MSSSKTSNTRQRCDDCGTEIKALDTATRCPSCGGLLTLELKAPGQRGKKLRALFDGRRASACGYDVLDGVPLDASGVWRYRELVLPDAEERDVVSYPEGNTPLLRRASVEHWWQ